MSRALALTIVSVFVVLALVLAGRDDPQREAELAGLAVPGLLQVEGAGLPQGKAAVLPQGEDAALRQGEETADSTGSSTLGFLILGSPAVRRPSAEVLELDLGPVDFETGAEPATPELLALVRRSIAQGLRSSAEALEKGSGSLTVNGVEEPVGGGLALRLERVSGGPEGSGPELLLSAELPSEGGMITAAIQQPWTPPDRSSLLPPLFAIALAIATRKPMISLLLGVTAGSILVQLRSGASSSAAVSGGAADVLTKYFWNRFTEADSVQVIAFAVLMLAMVGNLTRNGGIRGLMDRMRGLARGPRSTQTVTYGMGLAVFFDDYANTVLVGSTMRPLTDKFRIAREKLAYLVDSTAAPVAGLSVFSTWIAFEVSTFSAQLPAAGMLSSQGYEVFLDTLPYRYYCLLTLLMVAMIAITGRDFGPMLRAEERARKTGQVVRPGGSPMVSDRATTLDMADGVKPAAWRAIVPLLAFVFVTLFEIARGGGAFAMAGSELLTLQGLTQVLDVGSGYWPLMIGSAAGFILGAIGTLSAGLSFGEVLRASWTILRSMSVAFGILYLAWMIGDVCGDLGTANFLTQALQGELAPQLLPVALLVLAGFIAFSTGSSWSTMSILLPLVVGLAFQLGEGVPSLGGMALMIISIGAVLEGAIFGDHCSPISDTTVLSSISCASDHIDHVRTQAPYALCVMAIAILAGYLPATYLGWHAGWGLAAGAAAVVALVMLVGRRVADAPEGTVEA